MGALTVRPSLGYAGGRMTTTTTWKALLAALAMLGPAAPSWSQPPAPRVEVPIEAVRLSDGTVRYGVQVSIGGKTLLAGLDTGASGLRLMPDAAKDAAVAPTTTPEVFSFGSGARPIGVVGRGRIAIGAAAGDGTVHLVQTVDCVAGRPQCPGRLGLGYGFLGNGLVGEGFRVLLGGGMGPTSIDTPLKVVGARRWIIELPRPGEAVPGRLVINPTEAETEDYRSARLVGGYAERDGGGLHDAVLGCLSPSGGVQLCGLMTLDTGASFVRVLNAPAGFRPWSTGEALSIEILDPDRTLVTRGRMKVGGATQAIAYGTAPVRQPVLQLGVGPYYAWSVLYDPGARRLGFKVRPPVEGLPSAMQ